MARYPRWNIHPYPWDYSQLCSSKPPQNVSTQNQCWRLFPRADHLAKMAKCLPRSKVVEVGACCRMCQYMAGQLDFSGGHEAAGNWRPLNVRSAAQQWARRLPPANKKIVTSYSPRTPADSKFETKWSRPGWIWAGQMTPRDGYGVLSIVSWWRDREPSIIVCLWWHILPHYPSSENVWSYKAIGGSSDAKDGPDHPSTRKHGTPCIVNF